MSYFVDKNNINRIPSNKSDSDLKKDLTLNNNKLDKHAHHVCIKLSSDLIERNKEDGSLNFFRESTTTMAIWLFIIKSYSIRNSINIEDIAREIAPISKISKPSLRLILENAKKKGFIKFTHNQKDTRSWIIEPEDITINEFKKWSEIFI
jgi:DNA-binding MarR family transcriptional regulator